MGERPNMPMQPIAITGMGMISPLGISAAECWDNLLAGQSGIRRITKFDPDGCASQIGGQLPESYFELEKSQIKRRVFKQTVHATRIIKLCAREAIDDSGLDLDQVNPEKGAVIIGTSGSSVRSPDDVGNRKTARYTIIREMTNALPATISLDFGLKGPTFTISAACASGSYAVATCFDLIQAGVVDFAVAGGVDFLLTKNNIRRGAFIRVLSRQNGTPAKAMRPFDRRRDGWVLSDGGCVLVLESAEHAHRRAANVYAWIKGQGTTSEGYSLYSPSPYGEGMARTMEMALQHANMPGEQVGYINANGTSTIINDICETEAIKKVFGSHAQEMRISAIKSMIGHTMGAAGIIGVATTALTLHHQKIPPTINYEYKDPQCDLDYVPNAMVDANGIDAAISNSFGMGGHNSVTVLTRNES